MNKNYKEPYLTEEPYLPFKDIPDWWDPENPQHQLWATMRSIKENLTVINSFPPDTKIQFPKRFTTVSDYTKNFNTD